MLSHQMKKSKEDAIYEKVQDKDLIHIIFAKFTVAQFFTRGTMFMLDHKAVNRFL